MKFYRTIRSSEKTAATVTFVVVLCLPFLLSFNPYYLSIFVHGAVRPFSPFSGPRDFNDSGPPVRKLGR